MFRNGLVVTMLRVADAYRSEAVPHKPQTASLLVTNRLTKLQCEYDYIENEGARHTLTAHTSRARLSLQAPSDTGLIQPVRGQF